MSTVEADPASSGENESPEPNHERGGSLVKTLSFRRVGAVYVWIAVIVLFCVISPSEFATATTAKSILNQYAITGLVGLSLVVPLAAGYYDLSIGYNLSFAGVFVAWLLMHTSMTPIEAGAVTLLMCVVVGLVNSFIVVVLKVDSFIGTLASGAILAAIALALSGEEVISVSGSFTKLGVAAVGGVQVAVVYMLVVMVVIGYLLERTQIGRRLYATGYDRETARLTGIRVGRFATGAFVTSALISGFAGMVLAATVSAGTPDAGPNYLIPAFSAAFLGATQIRPGRFNPWGTVIAVLLLGTGDVGLLIVGGPDWTPQLFEGLVLIAAVALTGAQRGTWRTRLVAIRARRAASQTTKA